MQIITDFIDLKITFLYVALLAFFHSMGVEDFYKIVCGTIFIGYNIHRWYIMYAKYQMDKKDFKNKKK